MANCVVRCDKIPNGFKPVRNCSREVSRWLEVATTKERMGEPPSGSDGYLAAKQPHELTTG